jgi:hypothetical protein
MVRAATSRRAELVLALLSALPFLPMLTQPFLRDDLNSIYQAALSARHPTHLLDPWMGGILRLLPKLYLVALLAIVGPQSWIFRLVNLFLHGICVYLIARVFAVRSGSRALGLWAAGLFAAGLAWYGGAVFQISNVTMVSALAFLLASWRLAQRRQHVGAVVCLGLAALCHEGAWAVVLFAPLALESDDLPSARYALASFLLLIAAGSFLLGRVGIYCATAMQYWFLALVPLNATMSATTAFSGTFATVAHAVVAVRPWAAYVALAGLLLLTLRQRGIWIVAIAWIVVFTLPFAAAIAFWPEVWPQHWLSRRYLYAPAVGFCALAALWLMGLPSKWRRAMVATLLVWSLAWTGLTLWGATREAASPSQVEARAEWTREMRALEAPSP